MKKNAMRQKLQRGEAALGIVCGLDTVLAAENLALAGHDFVLIDNQHGAWNDQSNIGAFRGVCLGGATPVIRVQCNDYATIGRALDRGALGIVVPMVNSRKEAEAAAYATRFPPRGGRSKGPFGTATYGSDYAAAIDDEVYLAVQIETAAAVERAEEILSVDGVDGCWLGPADLALTMGLDLTTSAGRDKHAEAILTVLAACRRTGKVPGMACVPETAGRWLEAGYRFVTTGSDIAMLRARAEEVLRSLRMPAKT
jgi:4-hydroxy-2-oxoheptanedioate aldolase